MQKFIFSVFIAVNAFLLSIAAIADCGCENNAVIDIEYIDSNLNKAIKTQVFGKWWYIRSGEEFDRYADNPYDNNRVKRMSLRDKVRYRIKDLKQSYSVVTRRSTPYFNTKTNGKISLPFFEKTGALSARNVRHILKAENLQVGCTVAYNWVSPHHGVDANMVSDEIPKKIKETIDEHTGIYVYKLGYELKDEFVNVNFQYDYGGGCA